MAQRSSVVTLGTNNSRLPDQFSQGAVLLEHMRQAGVLDNAAKRLRVQRQGGYPAVDALIFLVLFFVARAKSLRGFAESMRPWRRQLGAVAGRETVMHQPSLSRICRTLGYDDIRPACSELLLQELGAGALLRAASTGYYDGHGNRWDVFDFDPSVIGLRRRGLPKYYDDEGPDAVARMTSEAKPGHTGRHRGEVTVSRMLTRHAGSGLWVACEVHPGNGEVRAAFERSVQTVVTACQRNDIPREQAIMRSDGAFGHVPYFDICIHKGIHLATRLSHYGLLKRPEILGHLVAAKWSDVDDSRSGPRRQAANLGMVKLVPGEGTLRADGEPFKPVTVRVVAIRTQTEKDRGAGVRIDGVWYELLGTTLPEQRWPPEDVASLYYARAGIENGINQAHDLCLMNRLLSAHLPGQELITNIALLVYNLQTILGTEIEGLPDEVQQQSKRSPHSRPWLPSRQQTPSTQDRTVQKQKLGGSASVDFAAEDEKRLGKSLDILPWQAILQRAGDGWRRGTGETQITCPQGHPLRPCRIQYDKQRRPKIMFHASLPTCRACAQHDSCIVGAERRRICVSVDEDLADRIHQIVQRLRQKTTQTEQPSSNERSLRSNKKGKGYTLPWKPIPEPDRPISNFSTPLYLPAEARRVFREETAEVTVHVEVTVSEQQAKLRLVADSPAQRQRRRKTWAERLQYNAIPADVSVRCEVQLRRPSLWLNKLYQPKEGERAA